MRLIWEYLWYRVVWPALSAEVRKCGGADIPPFLRTSALSSLFLLFMTSIEAASRGDGENINSRRAQAGSHNSIEKMPRRQIAPGRSCFECRRRKVRCDRSHPCKRCIDFEIKCVFPHTDPPTRSENIINSDDQRSLSLEERLEMVERIVTTAIPDIKTKLEGLTASIENGRVAPRAPMSSSLQALSPNQPPASSCDTARLPRSPEEDLSHARSLLLARCPRGLSSPYWTAFLLYVYPQVKIFNLLRLHEDLDRNIPGPFGEMLLGSIKYAVTMAVPPEDCMRDFKCKKQDLVRR